MAVLVNRAKMSTSTTGTGTITLGSAEDGYQSFADAGVANSDVVRYIIEDGSNFEIGTGTYTSSGTTLSRTVSESSNSNNAINLSGSATVFVGATAQDLSFTIGFTTVTDTQSSSFTKPNDGYDIESVFFSDAFFVEVSGVPSSSYEVVVGTAQSSTTLVDVTFAISSASTHTRRGSYWGDVLLVGKKNTVTNKSMAFYNMAAGWTSQTIFPVSYVSGVIILDANDQLCIWASDAYGGGGEFNSNLVLASGASTIVSKKLTLT